MKLLTIWKGEQIEKLKPFQAESGFNEKVRHIMEVVELIGERPWLWCYTWVHVSVPSLTSCVTTSKSLNLSQPWSHD